MVEVLLNVKLFISIDVLQNTINLLMPKNVISLLFLVVDKQFGKKLGILQVVKKEDVQNLIMMLIGI